MEVDIVIVGGGLAGLALSIALNKSSYKTLLIEAKLLQQEKTFFDARSLALAPASKNILENLALWPKIYPSSTPIQTIHISQAGSFGVANLVSKGEPLGYLVELATLQEIFQQNSKHQQILSPARVLSIEKNELLIETNNQRLTIAAQLIIAADGVDSLVRRHCGLSIKTKQYEEKALITNIQLSRPHQNIAYERFTKNGPMALLPLSNNRCALVWSLPEKEATRYLNASDNEFLSVLQRNFGYRLGRFSKVGKRQIFPLRHIIMPQTIKWPFVFIGNAAHTLHPVAGQGFNLALRDVAALVQAIAQHGINQAALVNYQQQRKLDQQIISQSTDTLINIFGSNIPGFKHLRGLGILMVDNAPLVKNLIGHFARGYGGHVSDLICGLPLQFREAHETL
jgi:2-octaprenyl-6-methoxyphenol hydroxylase